MKNKEAAFDVLAQAIQNPQATVNLDDINSRFSMEDMQELNLLIPQVRNTQAMLDAFKDQQQVGVLNMKHTYVSLINLKDSLNDAMIQAKKGYAYVMWMYIITFYAGLALIATAVVFAAMGKTILAIAFGAIGLIDIVVYFLKEPPLELQASRSNYAQLSAALINWFGDLMNLNSYLVLLSQTGRLTFDELTKVSDKQFANTKELLNHIETYSEPHSKKAADKKDPDK